MKRFLVLIALLSSPFLATAANVGLSINLGADNYYGPVVLGGMRPQLVYNEPIIIQRGGPAYAPIYLRVPPAYRSNWRAHCYQYNACNRPVYFVNDGWYQSAYAPHYRHDHPSWNGGRDYYNRGRRGDDIVIRAHTDNGYHGGDRRGHRDDGRDDYRR